MSRCPVFLYPKISPGYLLKQILFRQRLYNVGVRSSMFLEQNARGPYIYQEMLRLWYELYRQPVSFGEFSTDSGPTATDIYDYLRFCNGVPNSRFQKYIIGDRRLRCFRYSVCNHL